MSLSSFDGRCPMCYDQHEPHCKPSNATFVRELIPITKILVQKESNGPKTLKDYFAWKEDRAGRHA